MTHLWYEIWYLEDLAIIQYDNLSSCYRDIIFVMLFWTDKNVSECNNMQQLTNVA